MKKKNKKNNNSKMIFILLGIIIILIAIALLLSKKKVINITDIKPTINTERFIEKAKLKECIVQDVKGQYLNQAYIKEATEITCGAGWKIEFLIIENQSKAKSLFNYNKSYYELTKDKEDIEFTKYGSNYDLYIIENDIVYNRLSRIDNTFIYIKDSMAYKDEIKKFVNDLGY